MSVRMCGRKQRGSEWEEELGQQVVVMRSNLLRPSRLRVVGYHISPIRRQKKKGKGVVAWSCMYQVKDELWWMTEA